MNYDHKEVYLSSGALWVHICSGQDKVKVGNSAVCDPHLLPVQDVFIALRNNLQKLHEFQVSNVRKPF